MLTISLLDWQEQMLVNLNRANAPLLARATKLDADIDAMQKELMSLLEFKRTEDAKTFAPIADYHGLPSIPVSFVLDGRDESGLLKITFPDPRPDKGHLVAAAKTEPKKAKARKRKRA